MCSASGFRVLGIFLGKYVGFGLFLVLFVLVELFIVGWGNVFIVRILGRIFEVLGY